MGVYRGRGQDPIAYGDYAARGGTGKSIPVHIYKAPEGFAIKMQVSEKCHGLFDEVPVYIGIVSASG